MAHDSGSVACPKINTDGRVSQLDPTQPLMTVLEVAAYLNKTPSAIYTMVARRLIPHIRDGVSIRFDPVDIKSWVDGRKVQPIDPNNFGCFRLILLRKADAVANSAGDHPIVEAA